MNNEVEQYVGELRDLRHVNHTILKNKESLEQWITWLDAEIRQWPLSEHEKKHKKELKEIIEQLLKAHSMVEVDLDMVRVSGVPYEVELQKDLF